MLRAEIAQGWTWALRLCYNHAMMEELEKILNQQQCEAVRWTEGSLLVLAGAGSGKTRVLTHRIAYLMENKGVSPWNILAITFTNKAAGEMRERVDQLVGEGAQAVWVSTFHSMCVRILRRHIEALGYSSNFSIYDADDARTVMRRVFKDLNIDIRQFKERAVLSAISAAKNEGIDVDEFEASAGDFRLRTIAKCYRAYQQQLKQNDALDFDDLINKTVALFQTAPEVLAQYQERFRYIMVDEYQDTNGTQFELVRMLADKYHNLCVVGDDDQSIYKFRGADIENILSFEKHFAGAHVVKLEQNYRSTKHILDAANAVIAHNHGRKEKRLWTAKEGGAPVRFCEYESASDEAEAVVRAVCDCKRSYGEQAILYRTNAQSRLFEERCVKLNVPYRLVGGVNFYQRKEIKDILAYLRIICNGMDDLSLERIINVPKRGIGTASLEKLRLFAQERGISMYAAVLRVNETGVAGKSAKALAQFGELIEGYRKKLALAGLLEAEAAEDAEPFSLRALIESLRDDTGYADELLAEGAVEAETRFENIEELINKAVSFTEEQEHPKLAAFLEDVALVADIDRMDDDEEKVTLMTLHGAKGLEFPRVYLVGMEEGLFPSFMSITSEDEDALEEERRLCYVGITRAMEELLMSSARTRMVNGDFKRAYPSRFIDEIPDGMIEKKLLPQMKSRYISEDGYEDGLPWEPTQASGGGFGRSYQNPYATVGVGASAQPKRAPYQGAGAAFGSYSGVGYGGAGSANFGGKSMTRGGGNSVSQGSAYGAAGTAYGASMSGFGNSAYKRSASASAYGSATYGRNTASPVGAGGVNAFSGLGVQKAGAVTKPTSLDYKVGDRVSHVKFGEGIVLSIKEGVKDFEVTVEFDEAGQKKMLSAFAKLKKL